MDLKMKKKRIDLLGVYIKEGASSLELEEDFTLTTEDLRQLTEYVRGSQLKKLTIRFETSDQEWEPFFEALEASNIQELALYNCYRTKEEYLHLIELVKDTKITNCTMKMKWYQKILGQFDLDEFNRFISCVVASRLETFDCDSFIGLNIVSLFEALPQTKFTQFYFNQRPPADEQMLVAFASLCRNLQFTRLTELKLYNMTLNIDFMKLLSPALKNSTLKKLVLSSNGIDDEGVDILVEGLLHSKINYLDLSYNQIEGANVLGFHLKDTQIKTLLLYNNQLTKHGLFLMPLKLSSVVTLKVSECCLTTEHFQKLMKSLKFSKVTELDLLENEFKLNTEVSNIFEDTNLQRVDFSNHEFDQEALICLAGSIRDSKLNHISLSNCFQSSEQGIEWGSFLSEIRNSTINSLDLDGNHLVEADIDTLALHLENSKVTHLELSYSDIGNGLRSLAKLTQLSHLSLRECGIKDDGIEDLALILKNTQVVQLDLDENEITSFGASNLALYLKNSSLLQLKLSSNKIESDGAEALARGAEDTFITTISVSCDKPPIFDIILWRNKIAKQRLLNLFKLISPKLGSTSFCFEHPDVLRTSEFLESCLVLCVTITQKPSAISVLLEDESIQLSREEIILLISDEFPSQFVQFLGHNNETDAEAHVSLLKKAEELGLSKIVEMFLIHRPLFTININEGILHPSFYQFLNKYNHPICNLDVEPDGEMKILRYFTKHRELIEGAINIIMSLRGKQKQ